MTLNIQPDITKIDFSVCELIDDLKKETAVSAEIEFVIKLVCKELLTNILSYSEASLVNLTSSKEFGNLKIVIDDNGKGFNYDQIINRDVTDDEFIMADGGRGIFLVREIAKDFSYSPDGRRVEVILNLE